MTKSAARAVSAMKTYGEGDTAVHALNDVDADFTRGAFTCIMGPSGSGKSTLMHCMAGLDGLTSGQAFIGDTDVSELDEIGRTLLRRDRMGFIFQAFNLIPTLSARENILFPQRLASAKPDEEWFETVVQKVGLAHRLDHRPSELSGGQQQRVAVARALASRPEMVFADEPTGNLDSTTGNEILSFMRTAVDDFGQTTVMVTHDPHAAAYADRVVFLDDDNVPTSILVRVDPDQVESVLEVLARTTNPQNPEEVDVARPTDALEARESADDALTSLFLGLGAVALLVGGVGIANMMVISVLERRAEIGLRRALGATKRHVAVQFLGEAPQPWFRAKDSYSIRPRRAILSSTANPRRAQGYNCTVNVGEPTSAIGL